MNRRKPYLRNCSTWASSCLSHLRSARNSNWQALCRWIVLPTVMATESTPSFHAAILAIGEFVLSLTPRICFIYPLTTPQVK